MYGIWWKNSCTWKCMHSPECTHYDEVLVYSLNSRIDGNKMNYSFK